MMFISAVKISIFFKNTFSIVFLELTISKQKKKKSVFKEGKMTFFPFHSHEFVIAAVLRQAGTLGRDLKQILL